ncbi:dioxygenase [Nannochloropsis oceanica]
MTPPAVTKEVIVPAEEGTDSGVAKKQKMANGEAKASAAAADSHGFTILNDSKVNTPDARIYEYVSACNPDMAAIPALAHPPELHESGPTRILHFDLSAHMGVDYQATSPNLLAAYVRVLKDESIETQACATSQAFYVIRGQGKSTSTEHNLQVVYKQGDLFVMPHAAGPILHEAEEDLALYWVSDAPLLKYLGVAPNVKTFAPTVYRKDVLEAHVEELRHADGSEHKNRLGILLGNRVTESNTKTLTPTLWSLLNLLPKKTHQPPHRHNSVALDLAVHAAPDGVYTLMGPELGEDGWVKDPIRLDWKTGGSFITPPGWWHSHHNDTDEDAWVLPMQDAGLYTHMRSLDIRFSKANKWPRIE